MGEDANHGFHPEVHFDAAWRSNNNHVAQAAREPRARSFEHPPAPNPYPVKPSRDLHVHA